MLQDLRFALRLIAKDRSYTAVAVFALALGIGINATVFTISGAALFKGLPFHDSDRLYVLAWQGRGESRVNVSYAELQEWREQARTFTGLAAFSDTSVNISGDGAVPEQARGTRLTANAFGLLGQQPLLGRDFAPGDDRKGAERVVIIGYRIWKSRYAADPGVLGKSVRLNGEPATIVGVMPDGMKFPRNAELWIPFIPLGLAGAVAVSRVMVRLLVQVTPTDPFTFAAITTIVTVVAVTACVLPARRAARVDPLVALRA